MSHAYANSGLPRMDRSGVWSALIPLSTAARSDGLAVAAGAAAGAAAGGGAAAGRQLPGAAGCWSLAHQPHPVGGPAGRAAGRLSDPLCGHVRRLAVSVLGRHVCGRSRALLSTA